MVYLNLGYAIVTSAFIYLEWQVFTPLLNYVVLFYGAFVGIHAIFDTYTDTVRRTVLRSDAYACYEECRCCMPKCVGIQWASLNIFLQIFGVWVAMVQMSDECENMGWWQCITDDSPWDLNTNKFWEWGEQSVNTAKDWVN